VVHPQVSTVQMSKKAVMGGDRHSARQFHGVDGP
jgi:hypothetical protein